MPDDFCCQKKWLSNGRTWMSMELSNYLVSWVITYLRDLQPTFTGVIIHLLSTMDIQVVNPP